jgi:hypothetical protein
MPRHGCAAAVGLRGSGGRHRTDAPAPLVGGLLLAAISGWPGTWILLACALFWPAFFGAIIVRSVRALPEAQRHICIELAQACVKVRNGSVSSEVAWSAIARWTQRVGVLLLYVEGSLPIPIPTRAIAGRRGAVEQMLESHARAKA